MCICKLQEIPGQTHRLSSTLCPCDWKHTDQIVLHDASGVVWGNESKTSCLKREEHQNMSDHCMLNHVSLPICSLKLVLTNQLIVWNIFCLRCPPLIHPPHKMAFYWFCTLLYNHIADASWVFESVTLLLLSTIYSCESCSLTDVTCSNMSMCGDLFMCFMYGFRAAQWCRFQQTDEYIEYFATFRERLQKKMKNFHSNKGRGLSKVKQM